MKKPRFFCEHCGAEVDRNAKNCPHCGRYFASVRCPACGFTGAEGLFGNGCPVCGYSAPNSGSPEWPDSKPPKAAAGALPTWVYIVTLLALAAVLAALFLNIRN